MSTVVDEATDAFLAEFGSSDLAPVRSTRQVNVQIAAYERHRRQKTFIESKAKRKIARCGRRGGKTTAVAIIAALAFLAGKRVLYAAPTADQISKFWGEVVEYFAEAIREGVYVLNKADHTISLPGLEDINKARIRAKTAWNADTLRGDFADLLILDEFQLMAEDAWGVVGAPMLMDNNGDAIFIYTPPSLHSKSVSKAVDKRHASKMFAQAQKEEMAAKAAGQEPLIATFHWTSYDNPYLSQEGLAAVSKDLTELARRQEILAEDINELPGALWKRATLAKCRVSFLPSLSRVGVGVDPPGGATNCGIIAAGIGECTCQGTKEQHGFVIADASTQPGEGPEIWSQRAIDTMRNNDGDFIVAEKNFGGDMVAHTIHTADPKAYVKEVNASRGKAVRAEPIAALYEQGKVHHYGDEIKFQDLEDEQCQWKPGSGPSPNRMDALVWILTDMMVQPDYAPATDGAVVLGTAKNPEFSSMWGLPSQF